MPKKQDLQDFEQGATESGFETLKKRLQAQKVLADPTIQIPPVQQGSAPIGMDLDAIREAFGAQDRLAKQRQLNAQIQDNESSGQPMPEEQSQMPAENLADLAAQAKMKDEEDMKKMMAMELLKKKAGY